jgi:hypothetical protein
MPGKCPDTGFSKKRTVSGLASALSGGALWRATVGCLGWYDRNALWFSKAWCVDIEDPRGPNLPSYEPRFASAKLSFR